MRGESEANPCEVKQTVASLEAIGNGSLLLAPKTETACSSTSIAPVARSLERAFVPGC